MLSQMVTGARYIVRGATLLGVPGMKRYVAIPLTINVFTFALLLWFAVAQFSAIVERVTPQLPDWLAWLAWVLWILFGIAAAVAILFGFTIVANFISAPFNGLLAEAIERHLTGREPPGSGTWVQTLRTAPAQLIDEVRKLAYYLKWAIPLLVLFVIPVVYSIIDRKQWAPVAEGAPTVQGAGT